MKLKTSQAILESKAMFKEMVSEELIGGFNNWSISHFDKESLKELITQNYGNVDNVDWTDDLETIVDSLSELRLIAHDCYEMINSNLVVVVYRNNN